MPDERTLKELLQPLSAKVMPRAFLFSAGGNELTQQAAIAKQRIEASNVFNHVTRVPVKRSKYG